MVNLTFLIPPLDEFPPPVAKLVKSFGTTSGITIVGQLSKLEPLTLNAPFSVQASLSLWRLTTTRANGLESRATMFPCSGTCQKFRSTRRYRNVSRFGTSHGSVTFRDFR